MEIKQYISYFITEQNSDQQEVLIALIADFGFSGFEQNEEGFSANAAAGDINETETEAWLHANGISFSKKQIQEENWNQQWEQSFEPIVVGDFCAVRAAFHLPVAGVQHEIIITPKMSFGTGHHATTYMMMQAMQYMDFSDKKVIDFGTGTGILAILAEKMGAPSIVAIDYDDWCIENATENILANDCNHIILQKAADLKQAKPAAIILANINKNVILENLAAMSAHLPETGILLVSGLLTTDEDEITAAAMHHQFHKRQVIHRSGWICILFMPALP